MCDSYEAWLFEHPFLTLELDDWVLRDLEYGWVGDRFSIKVEIEEISATPLLSSESKVERAMRRERKLTKSRRRHRERKGQTRWGRSWGTPPGPADPDFNETVWADYINVEDWREAARYPDWRLRAVMCCKLCDDTSKRIATERRLKKREFQQAARAFKESHGDKEDDDSLWTSPEEESLPEEESIPCWSLSFTPVQCLVGMELQDLDAPQSPTLSSIGSDWDEVSIAASEDFIVI